MRYDERDDAELVELAQAGWGPAFAVLVHRHAPMLLAATADDRDPWGATLDVLVRALRQLADRDPSAPVAPWLLELAGRDAPSTVPAADPDELDALWHELDTRWPDGKRPRRRVPAAVRWTALALGAIGVGIAVPAAVINTAPPEDPVTVELRAQPVADAAADVDEELEEPEPLPTFEFPDVASDDAGTGDDAPTPDAPTTPAAGAEAPADAGPVGGATTPEAPAADGGAVDDEGADDPGDDAVGDGTAVDDAGVDEAAGDAPPEDAAADGEGTEPSGTGGSLGGIGDAVDELADDGADDATGDQR